MALEFATVLVAGLYLGDAIRKRVIWNDGRACLGLAVAAALGVLLGIEPLVVLVGTPALAAGFLWSKH